MLVLTRHNEQTIIIDERIVIKILRSRSNRVSVGIQAPADVSIRRGEITLLENDNADSES